MNSLIKRLPKAELHIHIEGSLEPALMFRLAKKNKIALPYHSIEEVKSAYRFTDLQSFLDIYYRSAAVLITEQDFYDLTWAYLAKCVENNIVHAEIFFDPQTHTQHGIDFDTVVNGIHKALLDGQNKLEISSRLICCFLRHLSQEEAFITLDQASKHKDKIIAIGLDSSENGNPPEKFEQVFTLARERGFLTVAHAGEEGPIDYINQCLDKLKALRIDHGVRCLEDPNIVARLVKYQTALTVCPLSNVKLRIFNSIEEHPLKRLFDAGLCVTINSDDPAYFGGYINDNYQAAVDGLGLTDEELKLIAINSFKASFMAEEQKQKYIELIRVC